MSTIQQEIVAKFAAKLAKSKKVNAAKAEALRKLLTTGKKPKADEFVRIFSAAADGDIK